MAFLKIFSKKQKTVAELSCFESPDMAIENFPAATRLITGLKVFSGYGRYI
jgi:hypothetical protein